jgi:hypothetical protein
MSLGKYQLKQLTVLTNTEYWEFYVHVTAYRNKFLYNKTN